MAKLNVFENKKLVLKNVLIEQNNNIKFDEIDKKITDFENKIKLLKIQTFGPLVTKMYGTQINEEGQLSANYDIMIQAHDFEQYKKQFRIHKKLTAEYCVYVRFSDKPEFVQMASSAMELFMYENDIDDSGILYTVILDTTEDNLILDYFIPVLTI